MSDALAYYDESQWVIGRDENDQIVIYIRLDGMDVKVPNNVIREVHYRKARGRYKTRYDTNSIPFKRQSAKRRAIKKQAKGSYSSKDVEIQYRLQNGKCWWCGKKVKDNYHIDHRIPLIGGGSNKPENICIACPKCNLSKGSKMPWEWSDRLL